MTKIEFLLKLEKQLAGLPESDLMRTIDYYNEIIDDRTEDTGSEAEAVAVLGAPEDVAAQVISEISLPKLVKEKIKPRRKMAVWEIVLLCVGSPIWVCLLIAAFAVAVALYAVAFSVVISLFAAAVTCGGIAVAGTIYSFVFFFRGGWIEALFYVGFVLLCIGLAIYLWCLAILLNRGIIRLTKVIIFGIKRKITKKEAQV